MKYLVLILSCIILTIQSLSAACGSIIYVKSDAIGSNNGSSWDNAYVNLQSALDESEACSAIEVIWIAGGTYTPTVDIVGSALSETQNLLFNIYFEVQLYGGFCGWESELNERIKYLCPTILSGDHDDNDILITDIDDPDFPFSNADDNSYNIMRMKNLTNATIIDGLTFMGGNADHPSQLSKRIGGAIFNDGRGLNNISNPEISNCVFQYNKARLGGGAIYNYGVFSEASPTISSCEFRYNRSLDAGGAIYNFASSPSAESKPVIINCLFEKNLAALDGGGIYSFDQISADAVPVLSQSTFVHNKASLGAGFYIFRTQLNGFSSLEPKGCIFYYNTATANPIFASFESNDILIFPTYSIYPEAIADLFQMNSSADPQFIDANSNFRLKTNSPAIDAGPLTPPIFGGGDIEVDLDDNARIMGEERDIGAYEFLSCPASNTIYVNDDQTAYSPSGTSLDFALRSLNAALEMACNCPEKPTIYVSEGRYVPHRLDSMRIPDLVDRRKSTYSIKCPMNIYGGRPNGLFGVATEASELDADFSNNDIPSNNTTKFDNAYTIMNMDQNASGSIVNGFNFENGNNFMSYFSQSTYDNTALDIEIADPGTFELIVSDCLFRGNENGIGGTVGIHSTNGSSNIMFDSCEFVVNHAHIGSALRFYGGQSSHCSLVLNNCNIQNNSPESLLGSSGKGPLDFTTISNIRDELIINNCIFEENDEPNNGGAISINLQGSGEHVVDINESEFYDNESYLKGGAIYLIGDIPHDVRIRNSYFINNDASEGGAIFIDAHCSNESILTNCIFVRNNTEEPPSGIQNGGAILKPLAYIIFK